MDPQDPQGCVELMVLWALLESLVALASLALLDSLEPQGPKETWDPPEIRAAWVFKGPEERLASLACQESQERWDHLGRMVLMGRKEGQETQELQDHQVSLGLGVNQASTVALDLQEPRG